MTRTNQFKSRESPALVIPPILKLTRDIFDFDWRNINWLSTLFFLGWPEIDFLFSYKYKRALLWSGCSGIRESGHLQTWQTEAGRGKGKECNRPPVQSPHPILLISLRARESFLSSPASTILDVLTSELSPSMFLHKKYVGKVGVRWKNPRTSFTFPSIVSVVGLIFSNLFS